MTASGPEKKVDTLKSRLRKALPRLQKKYAVKQLALHGSRLRDDAQANSDLDVLVEFKENEAGRHISLLDFIALKNELEELLGLPVDLGEFDALSGPAGDTIRREAEYV